MLGLTISQVGRFCFAAARLCFLVALAFPTEVSGDTGTFCIGDARYEARLTRDKVRLFFETTEELQKIAKELGLKPYVAEGNGFGRPKPGAIVDSLYADPRGIGIAKELLQRERFCTRIDFGHMQRAIFEAQNFIDIGEDVTELKRQLEKHCTEVCRPSFFARVFGPIPNCGRLCRRGFRVPSAKNIEALRSLQGEIPTSYILSWYMLRWSSPP